MITDMVMPQVSGSELIGRMNALRPNMKILRMSGYTSEVISPHSIPKPGMAFIQKPFSPGDLKEKVREMLAEKGSGTSLRSGPRAHSV